MPEPMTADDVRALLGPAIAAMLTEDEQRTLVVALIDADGRELHHDDVVPSADARVWWEVCDEGGESYLWLEDGPEELVAKAQSDLQDCIAESSFGWGERRLPRTETTRDSG